MQTTNLINAIKIVEVRNFAAFLALEKEWNELVEATNNEPFYRHEFICSWINNFATTAQLRVLTGRDLSGKLIAVLPLMELMGTFCGLPVRQLIATANTHSARFDLIAFDGKASSEAFFNYLIADKSWDIIKLIDIPDGGNAKYIFQTAKQNGFPVGYWESQSTPHILLPNSFDELMNSLDSKFKGNLRRRRKQLENLGSVSIEKITGSTELNKYLAEAFAIELCSWKARQGTGIAQDQRLTEFYQEIGRAAAQRNYLSLYFLKLNNRTIAFQYGLTYAGSYSLLKNGYDETYKNCSPGHILQAEVLRDCISAKLTKFDFLGDSTGPHMEWKMYWSNSIQRHQWIFIFRDSSIGQTLCKAKFNWLPAAKQFCYKVIGKGFASAKAMNLVR